MNFIITVCGSTPLLPLQKATGDSRVDPQTTMTKLWRNSWSITKQTHEKLTSICSVENNIFSESRSYLLRRFYIENSSSKTISAISKEVQICQINCRSHSVPKSIETCHSTSRAVKLWNRQIHWIINCVHKPVNISEITLHGNYLTSLSHLKNRATFSQFQDGRGKRAKRPGVKDVCWQMKIQINEFSKPIKPCYKRFHIKKTDTEK